MQAPSPARQRVDGSARPVRVLVVDDNAGFRESLLALLATDEMVVVGEADCGLRALDLVPELPPGAVLMGGQGGAVISPAVTPSVIEELTEALARERRRAWELEQANDALVERATRRHEMVARLGHELRTPVTVILGMAQILSK